MIGSTSGYSSPVQYLFVDGASLHGCLESLSRKFLKGVSLEVDFQRLAAIRSYSKVFYYDAIPVRGSGESESDYLARIGPQTARHQRAAMVNGVHVYEGDARLRRRRYEQKKVDVMIAVDLMHHTFRRNMQHATLLTGDGDFKPLVDAVVREGMQITLWYPPGETSQELLDAADIRQPLNVTDIRAILTDESIRRCKLPEAVNRRPQEPVQGEMLRRWSNSEEGNQELWRDGDEFIIVRYWDPLNAYHVRHENLEIVKAVCQGYPNFYSLPSDL